MKKFRSQPKNIYDDTKLFKILIERMWAKFFEKNNGQRMKPPLEE